MSESGGLLESLKRLAGTLLAIIQTRLELLSNELEEERLRIWQMLLFGSVALFFFGLSVVLLTAFVVVLFGADQRLLVLGFFTALYFFAGLLAWRRLCRMRQERSRLFSASLSELESDREQLEGRP
ncbi:MAG: phage holin family protein [Gallionellaceae bacterium]|nr:phage holin family protein [Gallionellaceae bacterium]